MLSINENASRALTEKLFISNITLALKVQNTFVPHCFTNVLQLQEMNFKWLFCFFQAKNYLISHICCVYTVLDTINNIVSIIILIFFILLMFDNASNFILLAQQNHV